jgi:hypothetical protein
MKTNNQDRDLAVGAGVGLLVMWLLLRKKPAGSGNVALHFTHNAFINSQTTVQITDSAGNMTETRVPLWIDDPAGGFFQNTVDMSLPMDNYTIGMQAAFGG